MSVKRKWAMPPRHFVSKSGRDQLVGVTTIHDTGKKYVGSGKKERERAAKRKVREDAKG